MDNEKIGFIGAGNMAQAIFGGLIDSGLPAKNINIADLDEQKCQLLADRLGVNYLTSNQTLIEQSDVVVLAVKPQILGVVIKESASIIQSAQPLLVSVAAGIPIDLMQTWVGMPTAVVRVMPNTPALVGAGMSGLYASKETSAQQRNRAESILRAVGSVIWVDNEALIDSVTAVSGSGPAYFFYMIETLEHAGVENGLSSDQARLLALETAFGAAKLALESDVPPAELRQRVMSPGGTTEAAIKRMAKEGFSSMMSSAIADAAERARELAELARNAD